MRNAPLMGARDYGIGFRPVRTCVLGDLAKSIKLGDKDLRAWCVVDGANGFRASDEQHPACQKLKEVQQAKKDAEVPRFHARRGLGGHFRQERLLDQQSEPAGLQEAERVSATGARSQSGGLHPRRRLVEILGPRRKRRAREYHPTLWPELPAVSGQERRPSGGRAPTGPNRQLGAAASTRLPSHTTECQADLAKVLDGAVSRRTPVRWVTFVRDDWLCLTADGFFTSNEISQSRN